MKHPTLLVVEDDPADQALLVEAATVADLRAELRFCGDGDELAAYLDGVDAGREAPPAVVLMDLRLPGRPGWDLVASLRARERYRSTPVLVHSSSWLPEDVARSYAAGASAFVAKALDFEQTVAFLESVDRFWFGHAILPAPG